jgi:hypothetical protein
MCQSRLVATSGQLTICQGERVWREETRSQSQVLPQAFQDFLAGAITGGRQSPHPSRQIRTAMCRLSTHRQRQDPNRTNQPRRQQYRGLVQVKRSLQIIH